MTANDGAPPVPPGGPPGAPWGRAAATPALGAAGAREPDPKTLSQAPKQPPVGAPAARAVAAGSRPQMVQKSHATEEEYLAALWLISHAHMDTYKELKDAAQMMQLVRVVEKLCKPFRLEQVLFAWLQRNGYLDTPERRAEPREMVVEHSMCQREFKKLLKDQGMRIRFFADNHGLFWIIPQASAAIFRPAYSRLRAWVASCRPTYQAELAHLLWPVLVHLALELIESDDRDKVKAAHDLLDSAKDAHYVQHREHFLHLRAMHRAQHVKESSMCRDFSPDEVRGPAPQHAVHHVVNVSAPNTVHLAAATYRLLVDFLRDECAAHGASVLMRVCYLRLHILVRRPNPPTVLPLAPPRRARRPGGAYMADSALLPFAHVPLEGGGGGAAAAGASGRGGGDGREGARKAMREAEHWDDVVVRRMAGGAGGEGEEAGGKRGAEEEEGEGRRKKAKGRREEEARGRERERDKRGRKAGGGNAAAAAAAAELRADRESISRPRIPEELVQRLRDGSFAARAAVGRGAMPSVCLCTLDSGAGAGGVNGAAVSPEGKFVVGCMQDSTVLLWDLAEIKRRTHNFRQPRTQIERHAGTNKWFGALSQPGSSLGAPGSGAGGALPWPGADGVQADACTYRMPARPITGHSGPVYAAAITTDDRFVASASQDGTVRVWTDVTKSTVLALRGHNHPVWDVAWSPEGHYLASASYDGSARLWAINHQYPLRMFVGHVGDVDCCTFLPCCNYIATGGSDRTVRVWDNKAGGQARCLTGLQTGVTAVAASGDGKMLAAGCESGEVLLWDVRMERLLARLLGHSEQVTSLSFSAPHCGGAGRSASAAVALLASGSLDGTVRLWDAAVRASEAAPRGARPGDADTEAEAEADAADGGAEDVAAAGGGGGGGGAGRGSEEAVVAGPLQTLATRGAAVAAVRFSLSNLVFAVGAVDLLDAPAPAGAPDALAWSLL